MLAKKLGTLLGLLMLLAICQTTFLADLASASHNCWRPPYHCFFAFGTYETSTSVSYPSTAVPPSAILIENSQPPGTDNFVRKVYVYTTDPSNKIEVELTDDAEEAYKYIEKEYGATKARGFMALSKEDGKKWALVDFYPADLVHPYPAEPVSGEKAMRNYISIFEEALLKTK